MAPTPPVASEAVQHILMAGAFFRKDPEIGKRVGELDEIPMVSEKGFDFYKINVLDDELIQDILKSLSALSAPRIGRRFKSDHEHYFTFMKSSEDAVQSLVVQLWSVGAQMEFFDGSHRKTLTGIPAANGLLEVPYAQLKKTEAINVSMEEGGLTILDARVAFRIIEGYAITYGFTTSGGLERWDKIAQK